MNCAHDNVDCLNEFEIIRKDRCKTCGEVMMCACEEHFGHRFLPHQLKDGRDAQTSDRVSVTLGFQAAICRECRGLPTEANPMAAIYGRTSKIKRYYWRELLKRELEIFGEWALEKGCNPFVASDSEAKSARNQASMQALKQIKQLHELSPKYVFHAEQTLPEIIAECEVELVNLQGEYINDRSVRSAQLQCEGREVGVTEFVKLHYEKLGYASLEVESVPFHVLFGVFIWLVIEDLDDDRVQMAGFGDRVAHDNGTKGRIIWGRKPEDFGTPAYGERRKDAIDRHFAETLQPDELDWLFDYWMEPSQTFRQYLYAHRAKDVEKAKILLALLPRKDLLRILRYLVDSYWSRCLGWPDLIIFRQGEYFLAEVKSSKDHLSHEQKLWIHNNHAILHLPFKLIKVHKSSLKTM